MLEVYIVFISVNNINHAYTMIIIRLLTCMLKLQKNTSIERSIQ
ncbi:protein of unknown function [Candidatus Nitrosocosmicus franklandus]|uniref:Uncharacterized protein n=1 Tax=Candidatus Nitrosocosmicus franklandianus TaxID=1798806 RepID=A0A484I9B6_9ARCH|nr:protein of unknown function [Candidatus Nitrosocosmicus franklandus]